jgi:hypothetical protein
VSGWDGGRRGGPGWVALTVGLVLLVVGALALLASFGALASVTVTVVAAVALVVVGIVVVGWALIPTRRESTTVAVERQGADRLALAVAYGAGYLTMAASPPGETLVTARSDRRDIRLGVDRAGGEARVRLARDVSGWDPFGAGAWKVQVAPDLPLSLEVQGGAGRFDVDLSGTRAAVAKLYVGAADLRCRLPVPSGDVLIRIEAGAAAIRLEVPPGVAFRARTEGFVTRTGPTEGGGYDAARDRLTIEMTGGAASFTIV